MGKIDLKIQQKTATVRKECDGKRQGKLTAKYGKMIIDGTERRETERER